MGIRYGARQKRNIDQETDEDYKKFLQKRNRRRVTIYETPELEHPDADDAAELSTTAHIWKNGDRLSKLANEYYGDPQKWWVIAWYNRFPTEAHIDKGDTVQIPINIEKVLGMMEV